MRWEQQVVATLQDGHSVLQQGSLPTSSGRLPQPRLQLLNMCCTMQHDPAHPSAPHLSRLMNSSPFLR